MRSIKITPNSITNRDTASVNTILNFIKKYPHNDELETELYEQILNGNKGSLDKLIQNNLGFAFSIAKQYESSKVPIEDLFQEACYGMWKAAQNFDPTKGFKFISYAVNWITSTIQASIYRQKNCITVPSNIGALSQKMLSYISKMAQQNGYYPSIEEVAEALNLSVDQTAGLDKFLTPKFNAADNPEFDVLGNLPSQYKEDSFIDKEYISYQIKGYLQYLTDKEKDIIIRYFGINREFPESPQTIAEDYKCTPESIRLAVKTALNRMKTKTKSRMLKLRTR